MQRLEVSGAVRPIYGSLGVKRLSSTCFGHHYAHHEELTTIALVTTSATYHKSCFRAVGPENHPSCLHLTSIQQQLEKQTAYVVTNAIVVSSW